MSKALQQKIAQEYQKEFESVPGACFVDYTGISSELFRTFRARCKKQGIKCKVIQNSLFQREVSNPTRDLSKLVVGPICVLYGKSEDKFFSGIKLLKEWKVENKILLLKGGYLYGEVYSPDQLDQLLKIGSKEQVLSKLLSCLKAPVSNLARTLNAAPQKLAGVLASYEKKMKESP